MNTCGVVKEVSLFRRRIELQCNCNKGLRGSREVLELWYSLRVVLPYGNEAKPFYVHPLCHQPLVVGVLLLTRAHDFERDRSVWLGTILGEEFSCQQSAAKTLISWRNEAFSPEKWIWIVNYSIHSAPIDGHENSVHLEKATGGFWLVSFPGKAFKRSCGGMIFIISFYYYYSRLLSSWVRILV